MTTDEIDVTSHSRDARERELKQKGREFGGGDSMTMQLSPEHLSMLNELAAMGKERRSDFELQDTQPVDLNDTQPILIGPPDDEA